MLSPESHGAPTAFSLPVDAAILKQLRFSPAHPSELARQLRLSPDAVLLGISRLQDAGFDIAPNPALGLQLVSSPDRLIADDLRSRMNHPWIHDITVFESTASTNDLAMKRGLQGASGPLVIFAETQTAGRGRFGRKWHSKEKEGIWMSLLLRPRLPFAQWPRLTSTAALAIALAIEQQTRLKPGIKWPNDVFVNGKKISGLLVETGQHPEKGPFAILGIGLNANQTEFPEEIREKASSLKLECRGTIDRPAMAAALLDQLGSLLPELETDFPSLLRRIAQCSTVLGRPIRLHSGETVIEGIAENLDEEGRLLVRMPDGTLERFSAGEVTTGAR